MERFTLTASEFTSLAGGYGDVSAVAKLADGQLAKRQLLICAVARRARATKAPVARTVAAGVSLLLEAESRAPDVVRTVLGHPQVDAWADRFIRLLDRHDERSLVAEVGYLCALAASAATLCGLPFEISAPLTAGLVTLPCLGAVHGLGAGPMLIRGDGATLRFVGSERPTDVPAPYDVETEHWKPLRAIDLGPAGGPRIAVDDLDQYRDCYPWPAAHRLSADQFRRFQLLVQQAWGLLVAQHPDHIPGLRVALRSLVPLRPPRQSGLFSATTRRTGGAIGVAPPADATTLALLVLHELQHLKLGALLDLVDLHRSGGPARHRAPWRMDPRPVGALLQGAYAHVAVTDFWRARRAAGQADAKRAEFEFAYWCAQTAVSVQTLRACAELTDHGRTFVNRLCSALAGWTEEPVSPAAGRAARRCGLAGATAWRLANLRASTAELNDVYQAWRGGRPCPPLPAPRLVDRPPSQPPPPGPRLAELIRRSWSGDAEACRRHTTPGDAALLAGDYRLAERRYDDAIRRSPTSTDDWVGLVVALREADQIGSASRPDLARDLYALLVDETDTPPGPAAVVRWCNATARPG